MEKIKTFCSIALIILFGLKTFAQADSLKERSTQKVRGYFLVGGGLGLPTGEYGNTILMDPNAGFAKTGMDGFLEGAIHFPKSDFGYLININFTNNKININSISLQAGNYYASEGYYLNNIFAGIYYSIPYRKISFDIKALAGLSVFTIPSQANSYSNWGPASCGKCNTVDTYKYESFTSVAFAFGGIISAKYTLIKNFDIFFQVGIIKTTPKTSLIHYLQFANPYNSSGYPSFAWSTETNDQPITLLNLNAGIGYQFEKAVNKSQIPKTRKHKIYLFKHVNNTTGISDPE